MACIPYYNANSLGTYKKFRRRLSLARVGPRLASRYNRTIRRCAMMNGVTYVETAAEPAFQPEFVAAIPFSDATDAFSHLSAYLAYWQA